MKKFMKSFAVLSALAMLAGSFVACSSDDSGSDTPKGGEGEGGGSTPVTVSISSTTITTDDCAAVAMTAFSSGAAKITANPAVTLSNGLIVYSAKEGNLRLRGETGAIASVNYNGGFNDAGSIGAAGTTLTAEADRYVAVKVVPGTTYSYSIPAKVTVVASKDLAAENKETSWKGKMGIIDTTKKVLSVNEFEMNGRYYDDSKDGSDAADAIEGAAPASDKSPTLTGTFTATGDEVRIVFSREGAKKSSGSSGGFDVISITLTPVLN